jgi:predicted RNA-binding Zn-ribbon protein involved in translation (DUF1610 family)
MGTIICSYCGIEVTTQAVESDDGYCPECGAFILPNSSKLDDEKSDFTAENYNIDDEHEDASDFDNKE